MKLIVGLGNPGAKYKNTRHNLGFAVVDSFARQKGMSWRYSQDWTGYYSSANNFVVIKPNTYMNKSGVVIVEVVKFYKIAPRDILVVYDDLDLEFGQIRLGFDGASAGHLGVESIIESLGTFDFARLRVGIGHPSGDASEGLAIDVEKYVLEEFSQGEKEKLPEVIERSNRAIQSYLDEGLEATMNRFN